MGYGFEHKGYIHYDPTCTVHISKHVTLKFLSVIRYILYGIFNQYSPLPFLLTIIMLFLLNLHPPFSI